MARPPPFFVWHPREALSPQNKDVNIPPPVSENVPGMPLKDFHTFGLLAPELQDLIWGWACHANRRTIMMAVTADSCRFEGDLPPRPSIMDVSAGARAIALKHFRLIETQSFTRLPPPAQPVPNWPNWVPRPLIPGWNELSNRTRDNYNIRRRDVPQVLPQKLRFYANMDNDIIKLRIGQTHPNYQYPLAHIARENVAIKPGENLDADFELQDLRSCFTAPGDFPGDASVPTIFSQVANIQLKLQLPPISSAEKFSEYAQTAMTDFCSTLLKTTIAKFPNLRQVDLTVASADWVEVFYDCAERRLRGASPLVPTCWKKLPITESDGVSIGQAQLGYLEQELRIWYWNERSNKANFPEIRLMVEVREDSLNELKRLSLCR